MEDKQKLEKTGFDLDEFVHRLNSIGIKLYITDCSVRHDGDTYFISGKLTPKDYSQIRQEATIKALENVLEFSHTMDLVQWVDGKRKPAEAFNLEVKRLQDYIRSLIQKARKR